MPSGAMLSVSIGERRVADRPPRRQCAHADPDARRRKFDRTHGQERRRSSPRSGLQRPVNPPALSSPTLPRAPVPGDRAFSRTKGCAGPDDCRRSACCLCWGMHRSPLHLLHRAEQVADRLFEDGALGFVTPRQLEVLIAVSESEAAIWSPSPSAPGSTGAQPRSLYGAWCARGCCRSGATVGISAPSYSSSPMMVVCCSLLPPPWRETWTRPCSGRCRQRSANRS